MAKLAVISIFLLELLAIAIGYRLPTIYNPSNYNIHLQLSPEVFSTANGTSYNGTVSITFTSSENISEVVLHASPGYITITSTRLSYENDTELPVVNGTADNTTEILNVTLTDTLIASETYVLTFDFNGTLSTADMYGFYKSSYEDSTTNTSYYLATTQMEATYARRAFPCFDEPKYKATFDISLTYPEGFEALGNMAALNTSAAVDGLVTRTFAQTPKMSTYLVAFIISDFTCTSGELIEGTLNNTVCSQNDTVATRQLALEVAPRSIEALNSYLSINYSSQMTKLDQVAIPDFSAGAMENWGLITYRERALLYDDNETSNTYRASIIEVINHELTHQWFGNLVTCSWWSEIFLNEGFATFFEYIAAHAGYPEIEYDKQFVTKTVHYAFDADTSSDESLHTNASTQSEISARFSTVSYDKGGSVLRMVQHVLGEELWKTGLNVYLTEYANSATEPDDLWEVLGRNATNLPANLTEVMDSWTNSPGYPVVNVSLNGTLLTFTQQRFVLSNTTATNISWYIPITYTTNLDTDAFQNTTPATWVRPDSSLTLNLSAEITWLVVNNYETGYYRVNYDSTLWSNLGLALQQTNFSAIPDVNRAQIVNDAFTLAKGGYITYSQLFSIVQFLTNETSYHVWYPALSGFDYLLSRIGEDNTLGQAIGEHILNLTGTILTNVPISTTNSSDHLYTLNQVLLQTWSCKLNNSQCTTEAVRLFEEFKNTSAKPDKNLRSIVYCYGLKHSSSVADDWQYLWNAFLDTKLSTEQVTILAALGCPSDEAVLTSYLNKTLNDDSGVRSQDYAAVFSAVYSGSSTGVDVALEFFTSNYSAIVTRYTSMNSVGSILKGIAAKITTATQLAKLQALIDSGVLDDTVLEAGKLAITTVNANFEWVGTYKTSLYEYYGLTEDTVTTTTVTPNDNTTDITPNPGVTTTTPSSTTEGSGTQFGVSIILLLVGLIFMTL